MNDDAWQPKRRTTQGHADFGTAARFFANFHPDPDPFIYQAKASRSDRNEGCEELEEKRRSAGDGMLMSDPRMSRPQQRLPSANHHPTVKSTALMQWLCRLITPEGGIVLDPFMGSGSTGKACMREGFRFVGIESDTENGYFEIAKRRIEHEIRKIDGDMPLFAGLQA